MGGGGWLGARGSFRREFRLFLVLAAFGLLLLPLLVYLAGVATLGPYEGGLPAFLRSLYGAFFTLHAGAWILLLGPYLLFQLLRLLTRPLRRSRQTLDPSPPGQHPQAASPASSPTPDA